MRDPNSLIDLRRCESIALHPSGEHCVVGTLRLDKERAKYIGDLWTVGLDGKADQWTFGEVSDTSPAFADDGRLLFLSNRPTPTDDSKERAQIWCFSPSGGEPHPITDEPLGVSGFKVAGDSIIAIAARLPGVELDKQRETATERRKHGPSTLRYTKMPVRFWDHWIPEAAPHLVHIQGDSSKDLTPDADREYRNSSFHMSENGRWVVTQRVSIDPVDRLATHDLIVFDLTDGPYGVVKEGQREAFWNARISPDGRYVCASYRKRSDGFHGGNKLVRVEVATGDMTVLCDDDERWHIPEDWVDDQNILCVTDDDGRSRLFQINVETDTCTALTTEMSVGAFDARGGELVAIASSILNPPEPMRVVDGQLERLASISGYDPDADISVEYVSVESTDGTPIQGWVAKRKDVDHAPCIMAIHGGPIAAWNDVWHWRWNARLWAENGYVVAMPNPRGSTGFGQEFIEGIWGNNWGGQCYEDLMSFADHLAARPDVDESQMVAMGGSFGGFMTNWIGCKTDRFVCLISHAGLANLGAFHGVTDMPAWWVHMFGESPYTASEAFDLYSPIRHIDGWKSPVLIIHGQLDYRVPVGEALTLFEGLQAHGVESELLIYPDENHWILKPRNIVTWYEATLEYIQRHTN